LQMKNTLEGGINSFIFLGRLQLTLGLK
jgi:hypothetical protein